VLRFALKVDVLVSVLWQTKAKAKAPKCKTKTKAVKICLEAASRRGTASRHHITGPTTEILLGWLPRPNVIGAAPHKKISPNKT